MKTNQGYYNTFVKTCAKNASRVAVRQYDKGNYTFYTYSELYGVCEYISQNLQLLGCNKGVIGIISKQNFIIPSVIAASHKSSKSFMFIDNLHQIEKSLDKIDLSVILKIGHDKDFPSEILGKKFEKCISIFNLNIGFYYLPPISSKGDVAQEHSFIALTSGSSGKPKCVQVPTKCIQPNIDDLTAIFLISSRDVIYFSTPLTFDPSMIEILLACSNGASLLIAPLNVISFDKNQENSVTFWQTTPSKFFQNSNAVIKNKILNEDSSLRVLAFGGEPLYGIRQLREMKHPQNKTRIFSLYGVTEMSCWACITEVDLDKVSDKEIPLGNCLSETQLLLKPSKDNKYKNIILASETRKCTVLNKPNSDIEDSTKYVDTGDIGENVNGLIYYRGRTDDVIKRFGNKVSLQLIEATTMQLQNIKTCSCVWLPKLQMLVLYFSSMDLTTEQLSDHLKKVLDEKHWPDKVIRVADIPTNSHGKISKQIMAKHFVNSDKLTLKDTFVKELKATLNKNLTYDLVKSKKYFEIGGTSFLAVLLCNRLSNAYLNSGETILPYLLSDQHTIEEIMFFLEKSQAKNKSEGLKTKKRSNLEEFLDDTSTKKANIRVMNKTYKFNILWTYDTGKCVDASPTLFKTKNKLYVAVGSHSGNIFVIDAITGNLEGSIPVHSRIEAAVFCFNNPYNQVACGVVGAYDGTVVCFEIENCKVVWKINVGAMVKSKATFCNQNLYLASYDGSLRCIDVMSGAIRCTTKVGEHAISADLVLAKSKYVLLGTLAGVCATIETKTNTILWKDALSSPIFARPGIYNDEYAVFIEVNGEIHCRTVDSGIKMWRFQCTQGHIYSSLCIRNIGNTEWQMMFGCHDHHLYSIIVKNNQPNLQWKTEFTSAIFSTPCELNEKYILAASTIGKLYLVDVECGSVLSECQLPGETFSSPSVYNDNLYIGCRNDLVYAIELAQTEIEKFNHTSTGR